MEPMRGPWTRTTGLLTSAIVLAALFCPCAMTPAAPAADAHECCPAEAGLRAADPSCCAGSSAPDRGTSVPAAAAASAPVPATSVLATLPATGPWTAEAPQAAGIAGAPPLVLRI
jgi:hypothetical protein